MLCDGSKNQNEKETLKQKKTKKLVPRVRCQSRALRLGNPDTCWQWIVYEFLCTCGSPQCWLKRLLMQEWRTMTHNASGVPVKKVIIHAEWRTMRFWSKWLLDIGTLHASVWYPLGVANKKWPSLLNRLFDIDTVTCQSYVVATGSGNKSHPALGIDYSTLTQLRASRVS